MHLPAIRERFVTVLMALLVAAAATPAISATLADDASSAPDEALLDDERWTEDAFGLSFRPPANAARLQQTADGAIATFLDRHGLQLSVYIRQTQDPVDLKTVVARSQHELMMLFNGLLPAGREDDPYVRLAERPGARLYFLVPGDPQRDREEFIIGQAFVQIDPFTVGQLLFETQADDYDRAREIFEALLATLELEDPAVLDARRTAMVDAGQALLAELDFAELRARRIGQPQWFRITLGGRDVGYMLREFAAATELGRDGLRIIERTRLHDGDVVYDSESDFFETDDGRTELWSIRTTERENRANRGRGGGPRAGAARELSLRLEQSMGFGARRRAWAETGVRDRRHIVVNRESPTRVDRKQWELPEHYLSHVRGRLLADALPRRPEPPAGPIAYYSYDSNGVRLALRTWRVETDEAGGRVVRERPAPDAAERVGWHDDDGRLQRRRMGDGRMLLPATEQEVLAIWGGE
ncbi:MAG: hypothetical protein WD009_04475 [Phycisphaeraceae bacterium]